MECLIGPCVMPPACGYGGISTRDTSLLCEGPVSTSSMRLSREQRRALKVLAHTPRGVSEEVLVVAHGFSAEMITGLVLVGLATIVTENEEGTSRSNDQG